MARCLIIGCGCRGRSLARELRRAGHAVRGTTRDPRARHQIEAAGAEAFLGDPDRVASLAVALEQVTVACILLGSASGSPDRVAALHGPRLEMLLARTLDTTIRGIVYEAAGSVGEAVLAAGAWTVRCHCEHSRIPYALLEADPVEPQEWLRSALGAVQRALSAALDSPML